MTFKKCDSKVTCSSKQANEPRLVGQVLSERLVNDNDSFAAAYRQHLNILRKEVVAL